MNFARATIYGRCGAEITVKQIPSSGKSVCNFSVAVNHKGQNGSEETSWYRVNAFDKTADICAQYLGKGKEVMVEGTLRIRKYQTKTGVSGESVEITANTVIIPKTSPGQNKEEIRPVDNNAAFGGINYGSRESQGNFIDEVPF